MIFKVHPLSFRQKGIIKRDSKLIYELRSSINDFIRKGELDYLKFKNQFERERRNLSFEKKKIEEFQIKNARFLNKVFLDTLSGNFIANSFNKSLKNFRKHIKIVNDKFFDIKNLIDKIKIYFYINQYINKIKIPNLKEILKRIQMDEDEELRESFVRLDSFN